jgi:hypothetical protein
MVTAYLVESSINSTIKEVLLGALSTTIVISKFGEAASPTEARLSIIPEDVADINTLPEDIET